MRPNCQVWLLRARPKKLRLLKLESFPAVRVNKSKRLNYISLRAHAAAEVFSPAAPRGLLKGDQSQIARLQTNWLLVRASLRPVRLHSTPARTHSHTRTL